MGRNRMPLLILVAFLTLAASAQAAMFTVTKVADTNDGACTASNCSLRDAVIASDAVAGPNTITLHGGDYRLTIHGTNEHAAATGDLNVTKSVTISGAGASSTMIDATGIDRIFEVLSGASLTVSGATLTGGVAVPATPGAAIHGGAVFDNAGGSLTFAGDAITGNRASGSATYDSGGAIAVRSPSTASITLTNTTLSGNYAGGTGGSANGGYGGAIDNEGSGTVSLSHVTATGNHVGGGGAGGYGGVLYSLAATMTVTASTFTTNRAGGGSAGAFGYGGALDVEAPTITDSTFSANTAGGGASAFGYGGAIEATSPIVLTRTVITRNSAGGGDNGSGTGAFGYGGGVDSLSGSVAMTDTTITDNSAGGGDMHSFGYGGGVNASVTADRSTISGNTAGGGDGFGYGGGIYPATGPGPTSLTNSTISGNSAGGGGADGFGYGGGIVVGLPPLTLTSSDVVGNTAVVEGSGGGGGVSGAFTSKDSIVADNTSAIGANCSAVATSHGHNLENGTTCGFTGTGDLNTEPHLGLLKDNGGLTPTQMPLAGSPAINHGETSGCAATDQRGVIRPQGPACDIGAYELAPPAAFTGGATIGHSAHVSLAGTGSNPDVVAGAVSFQWGKTTSYGKQSSTQALPVAASHMPFTISVGQLAAGTLYHYRAVAMNGDGAAYGADATFKTPNAPSLTKLVVRPHKFRPGSGAKHGASISYIDTQPALTTFTVLRASRGYKVGGSCRAHKPKGHKKIVRCTRYSKLGRFSHQDVSGTNRLHFTGLVKGKALAAGKYRLKAQARNGFGELSSAVLKSFRIF